MTDIKLRAKTGCNFPVYITAGKVYPVDHLDSDGDYVIKDNDGDNYCVCDCAVGPMAAWERIDDFVKCDLRNGDVVVMQNGFKYIYFKDYAGRANAFVNTIEGWMDVDKYTDELTLTDNPEFDVVEVYRAIYNGAFYPATEDFHSYDRVFKREKRKRMTVEEIEQRLGYKIAIVDEEGK